MIKENSDIEEMLKNVEHSTESAILALSQLEKNLLNGRFKEGIAAYDTMCKTLVGQRIWTSTKSSEKVDKNFKKISDSAKAIVNILQPYVQSLQKLTNIDAKILIEGEGANQAISPYINNNVASENFLTEEEKILSLIRNSPKGQISYTKLNSSLGWERKKLDGILKKMVEKTNSISMIVSSARRMIIFKS